MNDLQFKNLLESEQVRLGNGVPAATLGSDLDLYIDQTERKFYRKVNGNWTTNAELVLGPLFFTGQPTLALQPALGNIFELEVDAKGGYLLKLNPPAEDSYLLFKAGTFQWFPRIIAGEKLLVKDASICTKSGQTIDPNGIYTEMNVAGERRWKKAGDSSSSDCYIRSGTPSGGSSGWYLTLQTADLFYVPFKGTGDYPWDGEWTIYESTYGNTVAPKIYALY